MHFILFSGFWCRPAAAAGWERCSIEEEVVRVEGCDFIISSFLGIIPSYGLHLCNGLFLLLLFYFNTSDTMGLWRGIQLRSAITEQVWEGTGLLKNLDIRGDVSWEFQTLGRSLLRTKQCCRCSVEIKAFLILQKLK